MEDHPIRDPCDNRKALCLLDHNLIDEFIHSNTTNTWGNIGFKPANVTELDVSMLFAKAIRSINQNESVSELFV